MSAMIKLFLGPLKKWAYSDFMQEIAKPTRRAWVRIREAHMESLIKGVDWMEKKSREMPFSSCVLCSKSKYNELGNSRKSFLNEKVRREKELDELYPQKVYSEETFKSREGRNKSLFSSTHYGGKDHFIQPFILSGENIVIAQSRHSDSF